MAGDNARPVHRTADAVEPRADAGPTGDAASLSRNTWDSIQPIARSSASALPDSFDFRDHAPIFPNESTISGSPTKRMDPTGAIDSQWAEPASGAKLPVGDTQFGVPDQSGVKGMIDAQWGAADQSGVKAPLDAPWGIQNSGAPK